MYENTAYIAKRLFKRISADGKRCSINGHSRKLEWCIFVAIFLPTLFAGLRYGIGTDYSGTYVKYFETCLTPYYKGNKYEFLFYILNVIISVLGGNTNVVLYIASLVTLMAYVKGILYFREYISIGPTIFIMMLLSYNNMLNNTRQWIAVAIMFYGVRFCFEKKWVKYFLSVIVATGFHISALCTIPLYFIVSKTDFNTRDEKKKSSKTRNIFIVVALFVVVFVSQYLISFFENVGLNYYIPYLTRIQFVGYLNWVPFVRYFPLALVAIYLMKRSKNNYRIYICSLFTVAGVIAEILAFHVYQGGFEQIHRMANYFTCYLPIVTGALYKKAMFSKKAGTFRKDLSTVCVFVVLFISFAIWFNDMVLNNAGATLPYAFIFSK